VSLVEPLRAAVADRHPNDVVEQVRDEHDRWIVFSKTPRGRWRETHWTKPGGELIDVAARAAKQSEWTHYRFDDLGHGVRTRLEVDPDDEMGCTGLRHEFYDLLTETVGQWASWLQQVALLPSSRPFDARAELESHLAQERAEREAEQERDRYMRQEYPNSSMRDQVDHWRSLIGGDQRIWSQARWSRFDAQFVQSLRALSDEDCMPMLRQLAQALELPWSLVGSLLEHSQGSESWLRQTRNLSAEAARARFFGEDYARWSVDERARFWAWQLNPVAPYDDLHAELMHRLRAVDPEHADAVVTALIDQLGLDAVKTRALLRLSEDSDAWEALVD
jgi:hypothetical protein